MKPGNPVGPEPWPGSWFCPSALAFHGVFCTKQPERSFKRTLIRSPHLWSKLAKGQNKVFILRIKSKLPREVWPRTLVKYPLSPSPHRLHTSHISVFAVTQLGRDNLASKLHIYPFLSLECSSPAIHMDCTINVQVFLQYIIHKTFHNYFKYNNTQSHYSSHL